MNKHTEIIDRYFNGNMSRSEKADFEKRLASDSELKTEFIAQEQILKGIKRAVLKTEVQKGFDTGALKTKLGKWMFGISLLTIGVSIVLVVRQQWLKKNDNIRYELNEENSKNWSEADRQLTSQVYQLNGSRDTLLESEGGLILQIPARAFLNNKGDDVTDYYELEIKEALSPLAIMKAGLSTTANGQLLETGGMFYINARQGEKNLIIPANKTIHVSIPNQNPGKDMMLFEGKRLENGEIDWVHPKPLETRLRPVDIAKLNFYPPHFLDSLRSMGFDVKNKRLTDSIYYSFVCETDRLEKVLGYAKDSIFSADTVKRPDGETLFKQNCAVCHSMDHKKLTGPGMAGVMNRVPGSDWLRRYILNSERVIKSGDAYANKIYEENGKAQMTVFEGQLSESDLDAIIRYIGGSSLHAQANSGASVCEIAPSRIHAIWDKRFNNTLLATKEFETRLQELFKMCNYSLLDLYVRNLDHKMYEIDSVVMMMTNSSVFRDFYRKRQGGVSINSEQLKKLYAYMNDKQHIYDSIARSTLNQLYANEKLAGDEALETRNKYHSREAERLNKLFKEELQTNLKEAYRQLGKPYMPTNPAPAYYGTNISTTGWKNVDAYVLLSTVNRETLDYTDRESGKNAVIRYKPFSVKVKNAKEYDRVVAYLIPNKLSSFQKMPGNASMGFSEKLNELFQYESVVLAFKSNDIFMKTTNLVKPGNIEVRLRKISKEEFDRWNRLQNPERDLYEEFQYQVFEHNEFRRNQKIKTREELRQRLWPIVFPCSALPATQGQSEADFE